MPNSCPQMAGILHLRAFLDHLGHFLIIFFKAVCYFANCARGRFGKLRIWALLRPGIISNRIFLDTCNLQPHYSSNRKSFSEKIKKPLEIF